MIDHHLGERIAEARQQAGMVVSEMAELLDVPISTYQAMEQGEHRISAFVLARLARFYGLPIGWFYQGLPGQSHFDQVPKGSSV